MTIFLLLKPKYSNFGIGFAFLTKVYNWQILWICICKGVILCMDCTPPLLLTHVLILSLMSPLDLNFETSLNSSKFSLSHVRASNLSSILKPPFNSFKISLSHIRACTHTEQLLPSSSCEIVVVLMEFGARFWRCKRMVHRSWPLKEFVTRFSFFPLLFGKFFGTPGT